MYCVIMAGGTGTRFWPRSRTTHSKQFLTLQGKKSLIQATLDRSFTFASSDQVYIVSNKEQQVQLEEQVTEIPTKNILYEPVGKNTAACIGLAAMHVHKHNAEAIMIILPSDHLIGDKVLFKKTVLAGVKVARDRDGLVTIGIRPDRPATGYGYIQKGSPLDGNHKIPAYKVKTFAEKPDRATAQRFLDSGDFLWNSGMFIFKASIFLKAMEEYLPEMYDSLLDVKREIGKPDYEAVLLKAYRQIRGTSIDYGIMEKAQNVFLLEGSFNWSDLGSWEQIHRIANKDKNGNSFNGPVVDLNTKNSYVYAKDGLIALCDVEDIVVVQDEDAILICKRDKSENVKQLVEQIKRKKYKQYL
ncbi:mannose-1-phosphate guanylyltransferase [bacterium]|nr:mannose-1-phosphate guanylyltransferase [bacterium]